MQNTFDISIANVNECGSIVCRSAPQGASFLVLRLPNFRSALPQPRRQTMQTVKFRKLIDGDREDYEFLEDCEITYASQVGTRLLETLEKLETAMSGFQVTRLEHCLQTATRAWRDGADADWVVSALLHDIGDIHSPYDHDEYAALILRPFVREQCTWTVKQHGEFQKLYYAEQMGKDPNTRERHRDNPYFDDCA